MAARRKPNAAAGKRSAVKSKPKAKRKIKPAVRTKGPVRKSARTEAKATPKAVSRKAVAKKKVVVPKTAPRASQTATTRKARGSTKTAPPAKSKVKAVSKKTPDRTPRRGPTTKPRAPAPVQQDAQSGESQVQFGARGASPLSDFDNLDYARRHTTHSDGGEDDGWGRSAGHGQGRISQMSQYGADDDEIAYGRKRLGGRNRIPGAGSKRNR